MKKSGEWALINSLLLAKTLRSLPKLRGKGPVFKIFSKGAGSEFSHKKGGVGKIGKVILKKGGFTYFHTDYMSLMPSFSLCVMCVYLLLIYTISINILFVSQEQLSIIRFNHLCKTHNKPDTLLHKTHSKELLYSNCRSVIPLSKIKH